MGGYSWDTGFEMVDAADENLVNIVLVGKTGNGKSTTGNSILRRKAFLSKSTFRSVTTKSEQQSTEFEGRTLNVIDTPGLFDSEYDPNYIAGEIGRCISMAKDGIHAVLIVLTLSRFTQEEGAVAEKLQSIFGPEICEYMIVVFTHGDDLEEDETLDDRLANSPPNLKNLLESCGNRKMVFCNKSNVELKKLQQIKQLLNFVDDISRKNGGKPYSNKFFVEYKNGVQRLLSEKLKSSEGNSLKHEIKAELLEKMLADSKQEQMQTLTLMIITRLTSLEESTWRLEDKLTESNAKITDLELELKTTKMEGENAVEKRKSLEDEISKLKTEMERIEKEKAKKWWQICTIM